MAVEFIAFVPTRAKTAEGLTRALFKWNPEWFDQDCKTNKDRVEYVKDCLGESIDWRIGKGALIAEL